MFVQTNKSRKKSLVICVSIFIFCLYLFFTFLVLSDIQLFNPKVDGGPIVESPKEENPQIFEKSKKQLKKYGTSGSVHEHSDGSLKEKVDKMEKSKKPLRTLDDKQKFYEEKHSNKERLKRIQKQKEKEIQQENQQESNSPEVKFIDWSQEVTEQSYDDIIKSKKENFKRKEIERTKSGRVLHPLLSDPEKEKIIVYAANPNIDLLSHDDNPNRLLASDLIDESHPISPPLPEGEKLGLENLHSEMSFIHSDSKSSKSIIFSQVETIRNIEMTEFERKKSIVTRKITKDPITVLVWSTVANEKPWEFEYTFERCPLSCRWTHDRTTLQTADGIVFYMPEYYNGGQFGYPQLRDPSQFWTLWFQGTSLSYPLIRDPKFMNMFNMSISHHLESTVPIPWGPPADIFSKPESYGRKTGLMAYFGTSCMGNETNKGMEFVRQMAKRLNIHSFGPCMNNLENSANIVKGHSTFNPSVLSSYKFSLIVEEHSCDDFITSPLYQALTAGSVPVYLGARNVFEFVPHPEAVIRVQDFDSLNSLASFIIEVAGDEERYNKFLEWKYINSSSIFEKTKSKIPTHDPHCSLCLKIFEESKRLDSVKKEYESKQKEKEKKVEKPNIEKEKEKEKEKIKDEDSIDNPTNVIKQLKNPKLNDLTDNTLETNKGKRSLKQINDLSKKQGRNKYDKSSSQSPFIEILDLKDEVFDPWILSVPADRSCDIQYYWNE